MNILIADDDHTTCMTLQAPLNAWGHHVITAHDGAQAWDFLKHETSPTLAVLDLMMPGKTGLELCRLIRNSSTLIGSYIILLSSQHEKDDILAGLNAGANDFMAKPWDPSELKCRIDVGERVLSYQSELLKHSAQIADYAAKMEHLAEERARQLIHVDRMSTLGILSAGLAHEINNPVSFVVGNRELIRKFWAYILPYLPTVLPRIAQGSDRSNPPSEELRYILDEFPKALAGIQTGADRIQNLVNGLKRFVRKDPDNLVTCKIEDIIRVSLEFCSYTLGAEPQIRVEITENIPDVFVNPQQIEQVLINLITNAVDAAPSPLRSAILIKAKTQDGQVELTVKDDGPGFSEKALHNLWHPFFTTKPPDHGTGLGLSISRQIIEHHGGTITAGNAPDGGACITIRLPPVVS